MPQDPYARWMTSWETRLTTRDTNRVVRPLEWGFEWLEDFRGAAARELQVPVACAAEGSGSSLPAREPAGLHVLVASDLDRMNQLNEEIVRRSDDFFGYATPVDFRLER